MKLTRTCLLAAMLIGLGACSSTQVSVRPSPLWPFQQFDVGIGDSPAISSFYSRSDSSPRQFVVVIQSPPCAELHASPLLTQTISTSGVLWRQLQSDSAFLQFDRIGPTSTRTTAHDCAASFSAAAWNRESALTVAAVRKYERLDRLATVYVGVGAGTYVAAKLAAEDSHAAALVLINGSGMNPHFEDVLHTMRNSQSAGAIDASEDAHAVLVHDARLPQRLPILVVHASADELAPVEGSALLFSQLVQSGHNASLLLFDAYSHDLNLTSDNPDCFEAAMQLIAAKTRAMATPTGVDRNRIERMDCARAMQEFAGAGATTSPR